MLAHLSISDLAIIDRLEVSFGAGLQIITGETGAGKSIIVNSLKLLLGGRFQPEDLRSGASQAVVEGQFLLPPEHPAVPRLKQEGLLSGGGELVIRRVLQDNGRSRLLMNNQLVPLGRATELTRDLLAISGQHQHVQLTEESRHLDLLDAFGKLEDQRQLIARAVAEMEETAAEISRLEQLQKERSEKEDYYRFCLQQIKSLAPRPDEIERLEAERQRLRHLEKLQQGLTQAEGWLYEQEGSAAELMGRALEALRPLSALDNALEEPCRELTELAARATELARLLSRHRASLPQDSEGLEQLEERLGELKNLARRHGGSLAAALDAARQMEEELSRLEGGGEEIDRLKGLLAGQRQKALNLAQELSSRRRRAGRALAEALEKGLHELAMERARVEVEITALEELTSTGLDRVRLLLSANPGEDPKPLSRVASGGELSRVLLAFKAAFSGIDPAGCYVFDEVDSGIGGAVAEQIGRQLKKVACNRQVFCITHLPMVAAWGDRHYRVSKTFSRNRTRVEVTELDEPGRVEEIARMLAGRDVTARSREHAREILERIKKYRPDF